MPGRSAILVTALLLPRERMEADVIQGETVTSGLLQARGRRLRYFRHPLLHTGAEPQVRADFDRFLAGRGYTVAPVTFDNDEWIYAAAFDRAEARGDRELTRRIGDDYLRHMDEVFTFYEKLEREVTGARSATCSSCTPTPSTSNTSTTWPPG